MRTIIATIFSLLFAIFLLYLWTPDINFQSWGLWWTIFVGTVIIAVWGFIAESLSAKIPAVLVLLIMIFLALGSWSLFRADSYQELLGEPEVSDFTKDVSPISLMEMRIIDKDIAHKLGDKTLGEDPALGSVAEVNDFTLQSVGGKLYFVAPLEHSGFFRWLNNDYTTGYIKVSATNTNDISLVQSLNDKPIKIVYQPGGYFNQDLSRHIWLNGYMTTLTTNTEFEIDDEGNPWWIVTKYEKEVLMGGGDATGTLIVNPETGEIKEYSVEDTPLWVDRIQPTNFITSQINDWGEFIHGWWNFSGKDKLRTSEGYNVVYGVDGNCYLYTGITSVGSDEGTVGFMMVNTRNKKVFRYNRTGATESAAMNSAKSQVQEKGYEAIFPVPYNVNGIPTYFMPLVGNDGLPKMYSMVSIRNYEIVGVGANLNSTLRAYQRALTSRGNSVGIESGFERRTVSGKIERINSDISDGQTNYYILLEDSQMLFRGSSDLSPEVPLSEKGDKLTLTFDDSNQTVTQIHTFENEDIVLIVSEISEERSEYFEEVDSLKFQKQELKNANQVINDLSDEEKLKLLEQVNKKQ
tara:strand:+ start:786 stop:2519 length:1734 start_codon:yes stop_codon:yes gene_type:complete